LRTVENTRPCPGLSVPVVSVLDADGQLIEDDQRSLVRYVVQDGFGADMVFAAGTTGEWDQVSNDTRQKVIQVCTEEVGKLNISLRGKLVRDVELWAGVTAPSAHETLENLDYAISCGADAAVIAPLSIRGIDDPVRFMARDVSDLLDARMKRIPVYLYDNADIAIDPKVPHIRTRQVKAMSRLDFVRGIKVSAPRRVMGHYTKAAASFRDRGEFGIYVGNAALIFDLFRPRSGIFGTISDHWNRFRLQGSLPIGVVAGPGNVLPREWAHAWQVCRAGDYERMLEVKQVTDCYAAVTRLAARRASLHCLKRGLLLDGVISSDAVAGATPSLTIEDRDQFDEAFAEVRLLASERLGKTWVSRPAGP
jgi:dihydrodipicolinate synthase/N-acetylneuraminate lyase